MNAMADSAMRVLRRTGRFGVIGLVLLAGSPVFYAAMVLPLEREIRQLNTGQHRLHRTAMEQKRAMAAAPASEAQLAEFYGFFPRFNRIDELVARIYAVANRQGIALENGQYHLVEDGAGKLYRYQITLPLTASYAQISRFTTEILKEVPALALDDIGLKRENIGSSTVNARLRFTLFLRGLP